MIPGWFPSLGFNIGDLAMDGMRKTNLKKRNMKIAKGKKKNTLKKRRMAKAGKVKA